MHSMHVLSEDILVKNHAEYITNLFIFVEILDMVSETYIGISTSLI